MSGPRLPPVAEDVIKQLRLRRRKNPFARDLADLGFALHALGDQSCKLVQFQARFQRGDTPKVDRGDGKMIRELGIDYIRDIQVLEYEGRYFNLKESFATLEEVAHAFCIADSHLVSAIIYPFKITVFENGAQYITGVASHAMMGAVSGAIARQEAGWLQNQTTCGIARPKPTRRRL